MRALDIEQDSLMAAIAPGKNTARLGSAWLDSAPVPRGVVRPAEQSLSNGSRDNLSIARNIAEDIRWIASVSLPPHRRTISRSIVRLDSNVRAALDYAAGLLGE